MTKKKLLSCMQRKLPLIISHDKDEMKKHQEGYCLLENVHKPTGLLHPFGSYFLIHLCYFNFRYSAGASLTSRSTKSLYKGGRYSSQLSNSPFSL